MGWGEGEALSALNKKGRGGRLCVKSWVQSRRQAETGAGTGAQVRQEQRSKHPNSLSSAPHLQQPLAKPSANQEAVTPKDSSTPVIQQGRAQGRMGGEVWTWPGNRSGAGTLS